MIKVFTTSGEEKKTTSKQYETFMKEHIDKINNNEIGFDIDENGNLFAIPAKPNDYSYWNGSEWVEDEAKKLKLEAKEVIAKRVKEYGSIGSQLDEIFHDFEAWKARIQKVKDDNPKLELEK